MAHHPRPFYKKNRNTWYVEIDRTQIPLGKHPADLPPPKKDREDRWIAPEPILARYHEAMAQASQEAETTDPAIAAAPPTVAALLDEYAGWLKGRVQEESKAQRTLEWYNEHLLSFLAFLASQEPGQPEVPSLTVDQLQPVHVYRWVDANPGWKSGGRRGAMVAVQRALNWCAKAGLLKTIGGRSPLAALEKPAQNRREQLVSPEEYAWIIARVSDQCFRDLLETSWETGARPNELFTVEARHFDPANGRWVFPVKMSKGKKIQRVVYLGERSLEITRRLVLAHPTGPLFLNSDGIPWCVSSVKCRFQRMRDELGRQRLRELGLLPPKLKRLTVKERQDPARRRAHQEAVLQRRRDIKEIAKKHGVKYSLYSFRHAFCTDTLESGLDAVTVSVLMGHKDTTMISRHYSHLTQRLSHLRDAARKAKGA